MMDSEPKRLCGRYLAENKDDFLKCTGTTYLRNAG